jgi:hypothetical protein
MAVEVYFWPPKGSNVGHAAIMADGGTPAGRAYLSAWPGEALAILFGAAAFNQYEDDVRSEGGHPQVVRLTKLDETKIKAQIEKCKNAGKYGFISLNCATQASICLNAGVPGAQLKQALELLGGPTSYLFGTSVINTPWMLFLYARSLSSYA